MALYFRLLGSLSPSVFSLIVLCTASRLALCSVVSIAGLDLPLLDLDLAGLDLPLLELDLAGLDLPLLDLDLAGLDLPLLNLDLDLCSVVSIAGLDLPLLDPSPWSVVAAALLALVELRIFDIICVAISMSTYHLYSARGL